jgi:hypothetical protein
MNLSKSVSRSQPRCVSMYTITLTVISHVSPFLDEHFPQQGPQVQDHTGL